MVFSAAIYSTSNTGTGVRERLSEAENVKPVDSPLPAVAAQVSDKHDVTAYTLYNAPIIGVAGLLSGLQEAYYKFEKMPPSVSRKTLQQATSLFGLIGRKTLYATALGAVFCGVEATVENYIGEKDITAGVVAGGVTGFLFATLPPKPFPQPLVWPAAFALAALGADLVTERIPKAMNTFKNYGPLEHRPNWNDPAPPRPPIMDTGASARPNGAGHFWRGA